MVEPVWVVARWRPARVASALSSRRSALRAKGLAQPLLQSARRVPHLYILPAFNPLLRGVPVNRATSHDYLGPLFRAKAVAIEEAELYLMDGTFVGTVEGLRTPLVEPG
jgi:metallophosphoesterase superfamily enzyme